MIAADTRPLNGESFSQLYKRVNKFLQNIEHQRSSTPVVIFAHAGTIRSFVGNALGLSADVSLGLSIAPLSLTKLQYCDQDNLGGRWKLVSLNITAPKDD